uniref:Scavenger receptor class A n=1 Tax=Anopheles atroparvus TaxID=41427 RepID=A0AAG5D0X4_ANOAO
MRQSVRQRQRIVFLVALIFIGGCCNVVQSIYDPRTSPQQNHVHMMPEMHDSYSQVHHHRPYEPQTAYFTPMIRQYAPLQKQHQPTQQHGPSAPLYQPGVPLAPFPTDAQRAPGAQARSLPYTQDPQPAPLASRSSFGYGAEDRLIGETLSARPAFRSPAHALLKDFDGLKCPEGLTGHFVYAMDCRQFLNCWKGRGFIQSCAPGTLFNPMTRECDHASKVTCLPAPASLNGVGSAAESQQPPKFAAYTEQKHQVEEPVCLPGVIGLLPHPTNCRKFVNCNNGARYVQDCGPGTAFNPRILVCDHIHNVDCDSSANVIRENRRPPVQLPQYPTPVGHPAQVSAGSHPIPAIVRPSIPSGGPQHSVYPDVEQIDPPQDTTKVATEEEEYRDEELDAEYGGFDLRFNVDAPLADRRQPKASRVDDTKTPAERQPDQRPYPVYQPPPTAAAQSLQREPVTEVQTVKRPVYVPPPPVVTSTTARVQKQSPASTSRPLGTPYPTVRQQDINVQQHMDALKLMLSPYMKDHTKTVELNATKLSTMMTTTTTTTEEPPVVQVIGLPPPTARGDKSTAAYVLPTPSEVNEFFYGASEPVPLASWPLPPPYITEQPAGSFNRQHASPPESVVYPIYRRPTTTVRTTTTSTAKPPAIRSRFGDNRPNPWQPIIVPHATTTTTTQAPPTTTAKTTTTQDPCYGKFVCGNGVCIDEAEVCDGRDGCGNRADEKVCEHIGYEMKLSKKAQGSVQVKVYDRWGYVCDDSFGLEAANVVCREAGYEGGAMEVKPHSHFPPNATDPADGEQGPFFMMDAVRCQGNESSLRECEFNGWGVSDCNAEEVVGVVCRTPVMSCPQDYWLCHASEECIPLQFLCDNVRDCADGSDESPDHCKAPLAVRLAGGPNDREGRVEINYLGTWGTVCDDDFGVREARVICRQLGYNGTAEVRKNVYPPGSGQIWLDQVACNGTEKSIEHCVHWHWGQHNCGHSEDVGVRCGVYVPTKARAARLRNTRPNPRFDFVERSRKIHPDSCGRVLVDPTLRKPTYGARVVHGSETVYGHHPWQASLRVKTMHWCGAVLITRYHVLTAAHCLVGYPKSTYRVRVGDYNTAAYDQAELDIFVENTYIHEQFRQGHHMSNDIAVVVLKTPVRFNNYVQPICLPAQDAPYEAGKNCTISGWGATVAGSKDSSYDLRAGTVPLLPDSVCRKPEVYGDSLIDGMFCAGTLEPGVDSCDGDSGGPLVCPNVDGLHTLTGIVSWGKHCGYVNKPGVYLNVAYYRDWIEQKLNQSLHQHGV